MGLITHQYIDRSTGKVRTERLLADRMVNFIYSDVRENLPRVFEALTSARGSSLLGVPEFRYLSRDQIQVRGRIAAPLGRGCQ